MMVADVPVPIGLYVHGLSYKPYDLILRSECAYMYICFVTWSMYVCKLTFILVSTHVANKILLLVLLNIRTDLAVAGATREFIDTSAR